MQDKTATFLIELTQTLMSIDDSPKNVKENAYHMRGNNGELVEY